jgi:L-threonylcarbamoyladenylate synthase
MPLPCLLQVYAVTFTDPQLEANPTTPGMKYRHYSPSTPLVLLEPPTQSKEWPPPGWTQWVEGQVQAQHQVYGLGCSLVVMRTTLPLGTPVGWVGGEPCKRTESPSAPTLMSAIGHGCVYQYCLGNDSDQVAHNLFAALREVDGCGVAAMIVEGCVPEGAGLAVMNRLRKAATSIVAAK